MTNQNLDVTTPGRLPRAVGRHVFGRDVAGYDAGRLGYPDALFARLRERPASTIVEIGAGTGIATKSLLAARPDRLMAIEPDPALARHLRERFAESALTVLQSGFVEAEFDGSFDLVVAASCFHWLDAEPAHARVRSILRPGGRFALWWNIYRQPGCGDPFADAIMDLLRGFDLAPSEGVGGHYALDAELHRSRLRAAGLTMIHEEIFRRERELDADAARTLYASYSFVRVLDPERREALLDDIGNLVETRFGGVAPNVVLTPFYLAELPDGSLASSVAASVAESGK